MSNNPFSDKPAPKKSHAGLSMTRDQGEMFVQIREHYELPSDSAVLKMGLELLVEKYLTEKAAER